MTSAVVSNINQIRELTIDELDEAGGGFPAWAIAAAFVISPLGTVAFCAGAGLAVLMD
jgi:hypothetical protein